MIFFYRVKIVEIVIGMRVERRHMPCLLVPVAVVVVRHHGDPVEVPGEARHVVPGVNDLLAGRDRGGEEEAEGGEGGPQLGDEEREPRPVLGPLRLAFGLGRKRSGHDNEII